MCDIRAARATSPVTAALAGMLLGFAGLQNKLLAPEPSYWLRGFYLGVCQLVSVLGVF